MRGIACRLILCMTAFVLSCSTVPVTGRKQLSLVPQSELLALSATNYQQLLNQSRLSTDPKQTEMVVRVGKRIAASAEQFMRDNKMQSLIAGYQWEFNLIDDPKTVNAFCMPGGKIAAYTGILPIARDDAGLAVVMGHEVAHALANHGGERMSQMLVTQLGGMALAEAVRNKPEQTQELLLLSYGVGANVGVLLPYSRSQELEADHIGLILMARAGYRPDEAVGFWERMSAQGGGAPPEFLSTHPADQRRIDDIKKEIPEAMKYYNK